MNRYEEEDFDVLRKYLRRYERDVIFYSKPFDDSHCPDAWGGSKIENRLNIRADILNKMFAMHATEAELERFEEVNNRLMQLTEQLCRCHCELQGNVNLIHRADGDSFKIRTDICPYWEINEAPGLEELKEDSFYDSKWKEMICCVMGLQYGIGLFCEGANIPKITNNVVVRKSPFDIPILKNINVCSLFYALCTERKYSIPDVLRIKDYKIKQDISDWGNDEIQITI